MIYSLLKIYLYIKYIKKSKVIFIKDIKFPLLNINNNQTIIDKNTIDYKTILKYQKKNFFCKKIYWVSQYLASYLKFYIYSKLYWHFLNLNLYKKKEKMLSIWKLNFNNFLIKKEYIKKWYFFVLLIQLIFFKNPKHLVKLITLIISKLHIKKHKVAFIDFYKLIMRIFNNSKKISPFLGFKLYFKGKLGKKGSVRKTKIRYVVGRVSFTNKNLRFNSSNFLIYTETGVIGGCLSLFF